MFSWRLILAPTAPQAAAKKHAASRSAQARAAAGPAGAEPESAPEGVKVLDFSLDEVREAHLIPVIDFKGRRLAAPGQAADGARRHDEADGGRIQ